MSFRRLTIAHQKNKEADPSDFVPQVRKTPPTASGGKFAGGRNGGQS